MPTKSFFFLFFSLLIAENSVPCVAPANETTTTHLQCLELFGQKLMQEEHKVCIALLKSLSCSIQYSTPSLSLFFFWILCYIPAVMNSQTTFIVNIVVLSFVTFSRVLAKLFIYFLQRRKYYYGLLTKLCKHIKRTCNCVAPLKTKLISAVDDSNFEADGDYGDDDAAAEKAVMVVERAHDDDPFRLLPNELVVHILVHHLDQMWQPLCLHVCQRWNSLLAPIAVESHCQKKKKKKKKEKEKDDALESSLWCTELAKVGALSCLKWARARGYPWDKWTCAWAALEGHLEILEWARSQGCPWDWMTCAHAARGGHLEVLQWAQREGCPWNARTCASAARGGHLEVLQWARSQGCPWDETTYMNVAAFGSYLEILEWVRKAVHGIIRHVPVLLVEKYCNGREAKAVPGIIRHVPALLVEASWKCYNG